MVFSSITTVLLIQGTSAAYWQLCSIAHITCLCHGLTSLRSAYFTLEVDPASSWSYFTEECQRLTEIRPWLLGHLPFVRTGGPDWSARKWNRRVLTTERTGSGQTGPAHEVGPHSSLGPARNARSERSNSWRQGYFFFFVQRAAYQRHLFTWS